MLDELTLLRVVAIKGRVSADMVAASLDAVPAVAQTALDGFAERELVKSTSAGRGAWSWLRCLDRLALEG